MKCIKCKNLKSSMERFIDFSISSCVKSLHHLKSSMERFIVRSVGTLQLMKVI